MQQERVSGNSSKLWTVLIGIAIVGGGYYFYAGAPAPAAKTDVTEDAKPIQPQPKTQPEQQGLSRTQYDQKRAGHYGDAVKNSPSLGAHNQHVKDTEKAMQQVSNSR